MDGSVPVPVLADHRERSSPLMAMLTTDQRFDLHTAVLPVGDYLLDRRILIERKTIRDLAASVRDGRLFAQAARLVEADYPKVALLIEGTSRDLSGLKIRYEALQGAIINLSMFLGLVVLRSRSSEESLWIFRCLFRQHRALVTGALPRKGRRPRGRRALQYFLLQGLPGVGPDRARKLLAHFGTVSAVFRADESSLAEVRGIGRETVRAIRWVLD